MASILLLWPCAAPAQTSRARDKVLTMEATAFARAPEPTAAGTEAHEGTVAADPAILPLGTRIRVTGAAPYNGNYLVTDTGSKVKGMHIDLYVPSQVEAKQFGRKTVHVQVRQLGTGKADARRKDTASPPVTRK